MDKIIGFSLTKGDNRLPLPSWLGKYPWLRVEYLALKGWSLILWGHGDMSEFVGEARGIVVVGYSETDLIYLSTRPLQNRGLLVEICGDESVLISNDVLGALPLFYTSVHGVPIVSACEEVLLMAHGRVSLSPLALTNFLLYAGNVGTYTLWEGIKKLYANRVLHIKSTGFEQIHQSPLKFRKIEGDPVEEMKRATEELVRDYTEPLENVYLPLSSGHDSRLILAYMERPERIRARSYPVSWPADKSWEVAIPKRSAEIYGVTDHGVLDFEQDYSRWTRDAIEYWGTSMSATQVYLYGATELMYRKAMGIPAISGVIGDVLAGMGVEQARGWITHPSSSNALYHTVLYGHEKGWTPRCLDQCLTFNCMQYGVGKAGARIWEETEGNWLTRAALIRLRDHEIPAITNPWAAVDIWGSLVTPYYDRGYIEFMLSLPYDVLKDRRGQKELFARYLPDLWPHAGLRLDTLNCTNTLNTDTIRNGGLRSIWPLVGDGSKPAHRFFNPVGIASLEERALRGDTMAWFWLNSLQPIAWAIEKGYVNE